MGAIPMGDLLRFHADRKPADAVALVYPDGAVTWDDLDRRANRRARFYRALGVSQGDFVTIALPNGPAFHEAVFAVWKLGATPNVVSSKLPAREFEAILALAKPRLVIGGPDEGFFFQGWPHVAGDVVLDGFDDGPLHSRIATAWRAMTSGGSTGRPKVIVDQTPSTFDLDGRGLHTIVGLPAGEAILNAGPLYHASPFVFSSTALFLGSTAVGLSRFDAELTLSLVARHKVTWMALVPTMMRRIWALPAEIRDSYDLSALRAVWHMAAPCPPDLKQTWIDWLGPDRVWELYGGTEAIGITTIGGCDWQAKRGSVGRLVGRTGVKAVDEHGAECPPGQVGELFFRPPSGAPASRYLGAEFKRLEGGWVSIGDLGTVDEDGYIFLADRRVDLILRGGANIYPAEVEAALCAHPQVECAVVVGLPCDDLGQRVHAIIQPMPGAPPESSELHRFAAGLLARYKLPDSYEFTAGPLRDEAGKVRRSALREERSAWQQAGVAFRVRAHA